MRSAELLNLYENIQKQSRQMLEAARQDEWDLLIDLERDRAALSAVLQEQEKRCVWREEDQFRKGALIRSILANDAEIKQLVEPRRQELQNIFGSLYVEKKLLQAYAVNA